MKVPPSNAPLGALNTFTPPRMAGKITSRETERCGRSSGSNSAFGSWDRRSTRDDGSCRRSFSITVVETSRDRACPSRSYRSLRRIRLRGRSVTGVSGWRVQSRDDRQRNPATWTARSPQETGSNTERQPRQQIIGQALYLILDERLRRLCSADCRIVRNKCGTAGLPPDNSAILLMNTPPPDCEHPPAFSLDVKQYRGYSRSEFAAIASRMPSITPNGGSCSGMSSPGWHIRAAVAKS